MPKHTRKERDKQRRRIRQKTRKVKDINRRKKPKRRATA